VIITPQETLHGAAKVSGPRLYLVSGGDFALIAGHFNGAADEVGERSQSPKRKPRCSASAAPRLTSLEGSDLGSGADRRA
jgi:hypothetical protein